MKLLLIMTLMTLLVSGCQSTQELNESLLEERITFVQDSEISASNCQKTYYSYYLPQGVGRVSATETSNLFNAQGTEFVMNLNVSSIIQSNYYGTAQNISVFKSNLAVYRYEDTFIDINNVEHDYEISVYPYESKYILYLVCDTVEMVSVCDLITLYDLSEQFVRIAKSVVINEKEIVKAFSQKENITYQTKKVELFENLVPENGTIEELLTDSSDENDDSDE